MENAPFLTRSTNFLFDALLALFYPQPCAVCGESVEERNLGNACAKCWSETRTFTTADTICWKCGALALGSVASEKRDQVRCRRCEEQMFTVARACGSYEGALRASVLALKRDPHISRRLFTLLVEGLRQTPLNRATRIVPVPLHARREKLRGFNQAAVIGRELARSARLPLDEVSLCRTVHSERHRAGLDAKGRRQTVEQAFVVRYPRLIEDESILLVDDVFTTGATVSSCATALIAGGAKEVLVLTIAHTSHFPFSN